MSKERSFWDWLLRSSCYFEYSILCASLKKSTKHLGLSLGDRACISLGIKLSFPIYTADKLWAELKLDG